jgi:hypothetical protein
MFGRLRRRGTALAILGAGELCWGLGYIAAPATDRTGMRKLLVVLPMGGWASVWAACGALALTGAFLPEGPDRWGWIAAVMPPLAWGLGYGWAAAACGYGRGWYVLAWYVTSHALLTLWAASVAEYSVPRIGRCRWRSSRRAPPLLLIGAGQLLWGVGFVAVPRTNTRGLELVLHIAGLHTWALVWVAVGLAAMASAFLPEGPDRFGFAGSIMLPLVWAASYGWSWLDGDYLRGGFIMIWYLTAHAGMAAWAAWVPEYQAPAARPGPEGGWS